MSERDQRRTLSDQDYKNIRFAILVQDRTIREVANSFSVSTKYVRRLLNTTTATVETIITACSGCGYGFTDIGSHYATYTSGGTHDLTCGQYAPR